MSPCDTFLPPFSSCRHAWDALALQPGSSHDHGLLPLHVHGVSVSARAPGAGTGPCAPANRPLGVDPCHFPQGVWWIFRWPSVPHSERPSVEERSFLCKCPQPPPGGGGALRSFFLGAVGRPWGGLQEGYTPGSGMLSTSPQLRWHLLGPCLPHP